MNSEKLCLDMIPSCVRDRFYAFLKPFSKNFLGLFNGIVDKEQKESSPCYNRFFHS